VTNVRTTGERVPGEAIGHPVRHALARPAPEFDDATAYYPADKTIVDLFNAQASRTPGEEALRFGDRALTYGELYDLGNRMAAYLRTLGVGPRRVVGIQLEHSIEMVVAVLGVLKAGAAYVPIDPASPKARVVQLMKDLRDGIPGPVPVLLTQAHLASGLPSDAARVVKLEPDLATVRRHSALDPQSPLSPADLAYLIFTSGSTGKPKGVMIEHRSLVNYAWWAKERYGRGERLTWPLFSSLAFDLTVTSIFVPLISGGRIVVYRDPPGMPGMSILEVVEDGAADIVKLTPAHLALIKDMPLERTRIRRLILGGEDLKTALARDVTKRFGRPVELYNEYGPTEATVGCMIHRYDPDGDTAPSVPIGTPAANTGIFVLDERLQAVPVGVPGEMYLAGVGLARGYFERPDETAERFVMVPDPRRMRPAGAAAPMVRMFRTGDLARWVSPQRLEFLGRTDHQVKIGGARIELGEIEAHLASFPGIRECVAAVIDPSAPLAGMPVSYCARCGLASSVPGTMFDADGVCDVCRGYEHFAKKAEAYFRTKDDLKRIVADMKAARTGKYDCLVMLSGGKDSTYMLYQLVGLGVTPLVWTLDNGYISEEAKANIERVVQALGVDHVYGRTPHMNEIFVDSLQRFANVCNGCFKVIYSLSAGAARDHGIKHIVTGLSRGQFFETRLTEELFERDDVDADRIDALVLEARKAYHKRPDAVTSHIEVELFSDDTVLDDIAFVDFFRYWSAPLQDMHHFLQEQTPWRRPSDTGRSTNCLINDVGIFVHKHRRGFHNYALPYSWDVRLGQKQRDEAMAELEDEIDEVRVGEIMAEIGYTMPAPAEDGGARRLAAYYVSAEPIPAVELRAYLSKQLPDFMVPSYFVHLSQMPLTPNGKVDRRALPSVTVAKGDGVEDALSSGTETERTIAALWRDLLGVPGIQRNDDFFELGGHSLVAIKCVSRLRESFHVDVALRHLFEHPTVGGLAEIVDGLVVASRPRPAAADAGAREEITV